MEVFNAAFQVASTACGFQADSLPRHIADQDAFVDIVENYRNSKPVIFGCSNVFATTCINILNVKYHNYN